MVALDIECNWADGLCHVYRRIKYDTVKLCDTPDQLFNRMPYIRALRPTVPAGHQGRLFRLSMLPVIHTPLDGFGQCCPKEYGELTVHRKVRKVIARFLL